jgi:hypothetical protein
MPTLLFLDDAIATGHFPLVIGRDGMNRNNRRFHKTRSLSMFRTMRMIYAPQGR